MERKHGTIKRVLGRLQMDKTDSIDSVILERADFFSNLFLEPQILSSFELSKGYAPSILRTAQLMVYKDLLLAHTKQAAPRLLHRMIQTRTNRTHFPPFNSGDSI